MFSETHPTPMRTCSSSLLLKVGGVNYYSPFDWPVILSTAGLHPDVSDFTILSGIDVDDSTNAMFQFPRIAFGVWTLTKSSTCTFLFKVIYLLYFYFYFSKSLTCNSAFHFFRGINDGKTSRVHLFHNE